MNLVVHPSPAAFLDHADAYLKRTVLENNVVVGLAHRAKRNPQRYPDGIWCATIDAEGRTIGVAVHTPPWPILVSDLAPDACRLLADSIRERPVKACTGPEPSVRALAAALGRTVDPQSIRKHRLYALRERPIAATVPGTMRHFQTDERSLALDWSLRFGVDVREPRPEIEAVRTVDLAMAEGHLFLWDDGGPACMASRTETPPDGCRIGLVYTPPERRRRGYAGALVAAISARSLDEGRPWCCLFTDLDNPTSNSIYMKVGYRPIGDTIKADLA